ncbi:hypothetical protein JYB64_13270 [Algoriphagus aestuarii]|nr:hypothetical protein [Algoriphagus aestuarii]
MKNAYLGYSYQNHVATLLVSKMDAERDITQLIIEAKVDNDFDDVTLISKSGEYYCQIKDFDQMSVDKLCFREDEFLINGKVHVLSNATNIIFFKRIDLITNTNVLGFSAFNFNGVYLVSLSRTEIDEVVWELYSKNPQRVSVIDKFFHNRLDNRGLTILKEDLPLINVYKTDLLETTIDVGKKHLKIHNLLLIEGKPGVGKSHLVNILKKEYPNYLVYRFWVSNQDKDYKDRLIYSNFISDFSKKLFQDFVARDESSIIDKLVEMQHVVIIDGLDHVENYNIEDVEDFLRFIEKLKDSVKTIVLSRPLRTVLHWEKFSLGNWNRDQTQQVLDELFHIRDFGIADSIFTLTDGYPILVKYVAEYFRNNGELPLLEKLTSVDDYYGQLISKQTSKQALSVFLCVNSFLMKSELEMFLDCFSKSFVDEFLKEHPYLFEIKLNRISLYHDSFNTFLRKQTIDNSMLINQVNEVVFDSLMLSDKRFQSRISSFYFNEFQKISIIKKFASISFFEELLKNTIDFEAMRSFYHQLRELIREVSYNDLTIAEYYDLALITNLVNRDHIGPQNDFLYTYVKSLIFNGYTEEDLTSSGYLFGMWLYLESGDATFLLDLTSNNFYSTEHFFEELDCDRKLEEEYFQKHKIPLTKEKIDQMLTYTTEVDTKDRISYVLENMFVHPSCREYFPDLFRCVNGWMVSNDSNCLQYLESFVKKLGIRKFYAHHILLSVSANLLSLGVLPNKNEYILLSFKDFILENQGGMSFSLTEKIHNYLRLALFQQRKINIGDIHLFWTTYHSRKDYSLTNLDVALMVFNELGYIGLDKSIQLIARIQENSEKGYRALLSEFIEKYPPKNIIPHLTQNYEIKDLRISWFLLPTEFIDVFPPNLFHFDLTRLLRDNSYRQEIKFEDISNVAESVWKDQLIKEINMCGFSVSISEKDPQLEFAKTIGFSDLVIKSEDKLKYSSVDEVNFHKGILTIQDIDFISSSGLMPHDVAKCSDEYYVALADIGIYQLFESEDIREKVLPILYNAISGKTQSIGPATFDWTVS